MKLRITLVLACSILLLLRISAQVPQGFFLDQWQPRTILAPEYTLLQQTQNEALVSVTIDFADTLTKISGYLFGDNANLWTGCMANNAQLIKNIRNREPGVIRGPGGSISDVFFWNRNVDHRPADIPNILPGSDNVNWPWYGDRPYSWETWTMDVDSLYSIMKKVNATGMITVNYGYARYGTGANPVANAAHLAAEWVRYDKGRSKFWEIGNENFGSWEAGYRIDRSLNKDGQPEIITPALYGQHCSIFIDSMKAAAAAKDYEIKVGVVMAEASSTSSGWDRAVALAAGSKADFYSIHSYFTPYNENSSVETILNSYTKMGDYLAYLRNEVSSTGKPKLPVALTEYNIFAVGSNQPVSQINGMHAVLVTGEAMRTGYGAACRWDLANGYDKGNDHGMFSYSEPGIPDYTPHPAFYYLYYLRKFTGDVLLNSSVTGEKGIVVIPSAFHSGHTGAALVNTTRLPKTVRLNIANFRFGDRYYTYTLNGTADQDFSRKVFVNGQGNSTDVGGPDNYENVKANACLIGNEIRISIPPLSVVYVLVEPGSKELVVNNEVSVNDIPESYKINIYPNPSSGSVTIENMPLGISSIEITGISGKVVFAENIKSTQSDYQLNLRLVSGLYYVKFKGQHNLIIKKLVIK